MVAIQFDNCITEVNPVTRQIADDPNVIHNLRRKDLSRDITSYTRNHGTVFCLILFTGFPKSWSKEGLLDDR